MIEAMQVEPEERAELRRSFEFGTYIMITRYLAKTYGLKELDKFARFWAKNGC
jgi:hypothetical protein